MTVNTFLTNKKPPAWEAFLLFYYSGCRFSSICSQAQRQAGKGKEEKEIKAANLSLHFELHEAR
jgi:hypothetical protein